jgi:hypothetical protein
MYHLLISAFASSFLKDFLKESSEHVRSTTSDKVRRRGSIRSTRCRSVPPADLGVVWYHSSLNEAATIVTPEKATPQTGLYREIGRSGLCWELEY